MGPNETGGVQLAISHAVEGPPPDAVYRVYSSMEPSHMRQAAKVVVHTYTHSLALYTLERCVTPEDFLFPKSQ